MNWLVVFLWSQLIIIKSTLKVLVVVQTLEFEVNSTKNEQTAMNNLQLLSYKLGMAFVDFFPQFRGIWNIHQIKQNVPKFLRFIQVLNDP